MTGISIIICCHNSARRIEDTLRHIQRMAPASCNWEVLLIDNNCSDATVSIAQKTWQESPIAPFRSIKEPKPGLSNAREKGVQEATFPIIAFVDDDNHLPPEWIQNVHSFMSTHPSCAACGGPVVPKCESTPPFWFKDFQGNYSTYNYYYKDTRVNHALIGAGLIVRKQHLETLYKEGFSSILSDRKGRQLSSGGDYELCYALLLNRGSLWFSPQLRIEHFIPQERLHWKYLKRLNRGFGEQAPTLEIYEGLIRGTTSFSWKREVLLSIPTVIKSGLSTLKKAVTGKLEGSHNQLLFISQSFRLISLLRQRSKYDRNFVSLKRAPWNKLNPLKLNASS